MEIVYLYCAFSYLFMMPFISQQAIEFPFRCLIAWVLSPVVMPIHLSVALNY